MEQGGRKEEQEKGKKKGRGWDGAGEGEREDRDNKSSMGAIASSCVCEAAGNKRGENSLRSLGFHTDKQINSVHSHSACTRRRPKVAF